MKEMTDGIGDVKSSTCPEININPKLPRSREMEFPEILVTVWAPVHGIQRLPSITVHGRTFVTCEKSLGIFNVTNRFRMLLFWLIEWRVVTSLILVCVLLNTIIISLENCRNPSSTYNEISETVDLICLSIFATECALKIIARGLIIKPHTYLRDPFDWLDLIVVVTGLLSIVKLDSLDLSFLKVFRVLRPLRSVTALPQLKSLVSTIVLSLPRLGNVALAGFFLISVFSTIALAYWSGISDQRCRLTEYPLLLTEEGTQINNIKDIISDSSVASSDKSFCWSWRQDESQSRLCGGAHSCSEGTFCGSHYLTARSEELRPKFIVGGVDLNDSYKSISVIGTSSNGFSYYPSSMPLNTPEIKEKQNVLTRLPVADTPQELFNLEVTYSGIYEIFPWCQADKDTESTTYIQSFDNFLLSWLHVFEIITLEGWYDIMFKIQDGFNEWFPLVYFLLLIFTGSFFLFNVSLAVVWEAFSDVEETKKRNTQFLTNRDQGVITTKSPNLIRTNRMAGVSSGEHGKTWLERARSSLNEAMKSVRSSFAHHITENAIARSVWYGEFKALVRKCVLNDVFGAFIILTILLMIIIMAFDGYPPVDTGTAKILGSILLFCNIVFLVEFILLQMAMGPIVYWRELPTAFDGLVVLVWIVEQLALTNKGDNSAVIAFRSLRLLRILRLAGKWQSLRILIRSIIQTSLSIGNFGMLLGLILCVFALAGKAFFAGKFAFDENDTPIIFSDGSSYECPVEAEDWPISALAFRNRYSCVRRAHFDDSLSSFITVFQVLTGENWNSVMKDAIKSVGWGSVIFFLSLVIIGQAIGLNLFITIIMSKFSDCSAYLKHLEESEKDCVTNSVGSSSSFCRGFGRPFVWFLTKLCRILGISRSSTRHMKMGNRSVAADSNDEIGNTEITQNLPLEGDDGYILQTPRSEILADAGVDPQTTSSSKNKTDQYNIHGSRGVRYIGFKSAWDTNGSCTAISHRIVNEDHNRDLKRLETKEGRHQSTTRYDWSSPRSIRDNNDIQNTENEYGGENAASNFRIVNTQEDSRIVNNVYPEPHKQRKWPRDYNLCIFSPSNNFRRGCNALVRGSYSNIFDYSVMTLIVISSVILAADNPSFDPNDATVKASRTIDLVLNGFFVVEMFIKWTALGFLLEKDAYCRTPWNCFDGIIVLLSVMQWLPTDKIGNIRVLKSFRLLRCLRPLRVINKNKNLKVVVNTLLRSLPAIGNLLVIGTLFFSTAGLFAVSNFKGRFRSCVTLHDDTKKAAPFIGINGIHGKDVEWAVMGDQSYFFPYHSTPMCLSTKTGILSTWNTSINTGKEYNIPIDSSINSILIPTNYKCKEEQAAWRRPHPDFPVCISTCNNDRHRSELANFRSPKCPPFLTPFDLNKCRETVTPDSPIVYDSLTEQSVMPCDDIAVPIGLVGGDKYSGNQTDSLLIRGCRSTYCDGAASPTLDMITYCKGKCEEEESNEGSCATLCSSPQESSSLLCLECLSHCRAACECPHYCKIAIKDAANCHEQGFHWHNEDKNFDNLLISMRTLLEISTTEGWLDVMYSAVDAIDINVQPEKDHNVLWSIFFVFFLFLGTFFFLNLFIGIIIDNFKEEKIKGKNLLLSETQATWLRAQRVIYSLRVFIEIAYAQNLPWLRRKFYFWINSRIFEYTILTCIVLNALTIAGKVHPSPSDSYNEFLAVLNHTFSVIFICETAIKLCTLRKCYFYHGWNFFDFGCVLASVIGYILDFSGFSSASVNSIIWLCRIFRVLRLLRYVKGLNKIFTAFLFCIPKLFNVGILLFLLLSVYATLGVHLFSRVSIHYPLSPRVNFANFYNASITLLRSMTGEGWNDIMHALNRDVKITGLLYKSPCIDFDIDKNNFSDLDDRCLIQNKIGCGQPASYFYFISFTLLISFVILNLFLAVILEGFEDASKLDARSTFEMCLEMWAQYDPKYTLELPLDSAILFIDRASGFMISRMPRKPSNKKKIRLHTIGITTARYMDMCVSDKGTVSFISAVISAMRLRIVREDPSLMSEIHSIDVYPRVIVPDDGNLKALHNKKLNIVRKSAKAYDEFMNAEKKFRDREKQRKRGNQKMKDDDTRLKELEEIEGTSIVSVASSQLKTSVNDTTSVGLRHTTEPVIKAGNVIREEQEPNTRYPMFVFVEENLIQESGISDVTYESREKFSSLIEQVAASKIQRRSRYIRRIGGTPVGGNAIEYIHKTKY